MSMTALTRKELRQILRGLRVSLPPDLEQALLDEYNSPVVDAEGHVQEYTEQDRYEQIRKLVQKLDDLRRKWRANLT